MTISKCNSAIPQAGFLRLSQILGDPNATPPILPIIPIGRSSWWAGIKSGRYPKGIKLGPKTTVWRCEDIKALLLSFDDSHINKEA